jgi:hypothetical protein
VHDLLASHTLTCQDGQFVANKASAQPEVEMIDEFEVEASAEPRLQSTKDFSPDMEIMLAGLTRLAAAVQRRTSGSKPRCNKQKSTSVPKKAKAQAASGSVPSRPVFSQGMHVLLDWAPGNVWPAIVEKVESNGMLTVFFPTDSSFIELDLRRQKRMKIRPASMPTAATTSKSRPPGQKRKRAVASSRNHPRGRISDEDTANLDGLVEGSSAPAATREYKCGKCHLLKKTACLCKQQAAVERKAAVEAAAAAEGADLGKSGAPARFVPEQPYIAFARQQAEEAKKLAQLRKEAEEELARMKMLEEQCKRKKEKTKKAQQKREEQARKHMQARKQAIAANQQSPPLPGQKRKRAIMKIARIVQQCGHAREWHSRMQQQAHPQAQQQPKPRPASGFYGVYAQNAHGKRWQARIRYDGKTHNLGTFDTKQDAALAYDREARQCGGDKLLNYEHAQQLVQVQQQAGVRSGTPDHDGLDLVERVCTNSSTSTSNNGGGSSSNSGSSSQSSSTSSNSRSSSQSSSKSSNSRSISQSSGGGGGSNNPNPGYTLGAWRNKPNIDHLGNPSAGVSEIVGTMCTLDEACRHQVHRSIAQYKACYLTYVCPLPCLSI